MGLFSSPKKKVKFVEPAASAEARRELVARGKESVAFPARQIADLTEAELEVERQAQVRLTAGPSPEREAIIQEFLRTATTPADVANLPELQAIFKQITELGEIEAGRLGRGLQIRGSIGTTGGRDILGRRVTETQERLVGAAAPFLAEARGLKAQAGRDVGTLVGQREAETTGRLGLSAAVGELRRGITQAKLDVPFEKALRDLEFRFQIQPGLLQSALVSPQPVITGGGPSELQKAAGIVSQIAPFVAGISGAGGGGGVSGAFSAFTAAQGAQGGGSNTADLLRDLLSGLQKGNRNTGIIDISG